MKNLIIVLLVLQFGWVEAQKNYVPMSSVDSWSYRVHDLSGSSEFWLNYYGDTIINGLNYRRIVDLEAGEFIPFFTIHLREDTTSRKVYFYNIFTEEEVLLYDFDLEVGDLFITEYYDNFPIEVINKSIIQTDDVELYKWELKFQGQSELKFHYTESVGAEYMLFYALRQDPVYNLLCAYNRCDKIFGDDGCKSFLANQIEQPYNGIDDDCNLETLDDDLDQDGFLSADDCDDNNSNINPDQIEQPYNGIDDDCNSATLDDDLDQDGFLLADDCDDNNSNINPDQIEESYNGIDDDCNSATLDDDLDQDGFILAEDCDDNNSNINPDANEIPNNGIDEDCDGLDLVSSIYELANTTINILSLIHI